jgi:outer membrane protein OmpA-like peptidoglycan-associated protein
VAPPESTAVTSTPASAPPTALAAPYAFDAIKSDTGAVALSGAVPTEGARGYFSDVAHAASADLQVQPNPPENFVIAALGGIEALGQLSSGHLAYDGKGWSLTGKAATPEIRPAVLAKVAALPAGADWTTDVAGPAPIELCRESLATFASTSAINFDSRTRLSKGSDAELDKLAADLAVCPDVRVDVEGFTDSDGDADSNMALSVARAETVIDELVKRGIKADRLYAVGYGETLPLVPNTTQANKAKNRRIEFRLQEGDAR